MGHSELMKFFLFMMLGEIATDIFQFYELHEQKSYFDGYRVGNWNKYSKIRP